MKVRHVKCEACGGRGHRNLTVVERDTIQAIGSGWSTTNQIASRLWNIQGYAITGPALCNRLVDLESLGLAERRPASGKHYEWRVP